MSKLSEWLDVMLGEIARKQDEAARAAAEQATRQVEARELEARLPPQPSPTRNPS